MKITQLTAAVIGIFVFSSIAIAEPVGFITYSIDKSGGKHNIGEICVTGGTAKTLESSDTGSFKGIDAPPFLGDLCVISRYEPDISKFGIALVDRAGVTHTVIASPASGYARYPGFSFDGRYIVYVLPNVGSPPKDELHIVLPSGQFDTTIYKVDHDSKSISRPRFHPDGKTIIFSMMNGSTATRSVHKMSVTGGPAQQVSGLPSSPMQAIYSPDGRYIASVAEASLTLYIGKADGSPSQAVNLLGDNAFYPCFSPDSKYVAVCSEDKLNIIDISDFSIVRQIVLTNSMCHGLCWHLGARQSNGTLEKVKINSKKVSVKLLNFVPGALPEYGLLQVDRTVVPMDTASLWLNKKDKKYYYKDKTNKRSAKIKLKNGKAVFAAKKLSLTEDEDYRPSTDVPIAVNAGDVSIVGTFPLDKKGKYKAPKD